MAKKSRDKGKRHEREIAALFKLVFLEARRGLSQSSGPREADVEGTPFRIECKHHAVFPNPVRALEQADEDGKAYGDNRIPIAVVRQDRSRNTVTLYLTDFLHIMETLKAYLVTSFEPDANNTYEDAPEDCDGE